jgi:hypothetical protein
MTTESMDHTLDKQDNETRWSSQPPVSQKSWLGGVIKTGLILSCGLIAGGVIESFMNDKRNSSEQYPIEEDDEINSSLESKDETESEPETVQDHTTGFLSSMVSRGFFKSAVGMAADNEDGNIDEETTDSAS